jgi:hypothetical protein
MAEPGEPGEPSDPGAGDAWRDFLRSFDSPARDAWGDLAHTFDSPANYVIRVAGSLNADRSDYLQGLRITTAPDDPAGGGRVTELRGVLRDQAALLGVLTTLYNLGLSLLTVTRCPAAGDAPHPPR